jgi:hypothetical protein
MSNRWNFMTYLGENPYDGIEICEEHTFSDGEKMR